MVSKAKRLPTTTDALVNSRRMLNDFYGLNRARITTNTIGPPAGSGFVSSTSSGGGGTGSGLQTVGDSMVGPIAFFPVDADILNDIINISTDGNSPSDYSSYVRLLPEGAVDDDLLTIFGAAFSGQLLYLQGSTGNIVTIIEGTGANGGNILTEGVELVLNGDQIVTLIFDPDADTGDPLVEGAWRVVAGGSATGRQLMFAILSADQTANLTAGNHIEFDTVSLGFGSLVLSTGAGQADGIVSGFIAGRIYQIEYGIRMEGSGNAAAIVVRPRSNDTTDIGTSANAITVSSNENASFLPTGFAVFIPNADSDTLRLEIVASDSLTSIESDSTYFLITSDVEGGGAGGGGASILDQLNDVTITNPQTDEILQFNGTVWVNALSSAGQNQTPWVQNIDGDGFNLDFNMNVTRQVPTITNIKNIDFTFWTGVATPKGTINAETDRFEINVTDPLDDFFIKSATQAKFAYEASGDRLKSFVRLSMEGQNISDISDLRFRGNGLRASDFSQIFSNDTDGQMVFKVRSTFDFRWEEVSNSVPIMELSPNTIDGTTFGNIRNVVRIELPDTSTAILPQDNGDIQQIQGDVFITSGGTPRNISNIQASPAGDRIESPDTLTSIIATDGTLQMRIDGTIRWTMNSVNLTLDRTLELGLNSIGSVQNILPNSNLSNIGSTSQFFGVGFYDTISFERSTNFIAGNSTGLTYDCIQTGSHKFTVLSTEMEISDSSIDMFAPLDMNFGIISQVATLSMSGGPNQIVMNGGSITAIDDLIMSGSGSRLEMNGGDIIEVNDITMNNTASNIDMNGGDIIDIDDLSFRTNGSINLNGGDMFNVDDISMNGDLQIGGALNHDGSRVGFFGEPPNIRRVVLNPAGSSNAALFTALNDLINALGTINGFGLGLIDTQN